MKFTIKYNLLAFLLLFTTELVFAQGVGINDDNSSPDASAMLDVKSTSKGLLIPRMTTIERTAISTPATGLMVFDNTTLSFWYYDGSQWIEIGATVAESPFDTSGSVVIPRLSVVDETNDDFVFGSTQLDDDGDANHDSRLFFDKSLNALRAGSTNSTEWDETNIGSGSAAFGENTIASGNLSFAANYETEASGYSSSAFGTATEATASFGFATGYATYATGIAAFSGGNNTTASGAYSLALGFSTRASGSMSTALGFYTTASGSRSFAAGDNTIAPSGYETVLGRYNTTYTPNSTAAWDSADRLFTLGNGTSSGVLSNALTIYKDGTMNINDAYDMPTADGTANYVMTTDGAGVASWVDPNVLVTNESPFDTSGGVVIPRTGLVDVSEDDFVFGASQLDYDGTFANSQRFYFDNSKSAFRAGQDYSGNWDASNVGDGSAAFGVSTIASGNFSFAANYETDASGYAATAFGGSTEATENFAFAIGYATNATGTGSFSAGNNSTASGAYSLASGIFVEASGATSTALGYYTTASGSRSMAVGEYTTALSGYETVLGRYNTSYTPFSTTGWDSTDRLFSIGNGTGAVALSNALTIYKDGTMNINDAYDMPTADGTANYVMTTDGAGVASWADPNALVLATSPFDTAGGVVIPRSGLVDETNDDFVFGSTQLDDDGDFNHRNRFFFDKSLGAFRAGRVYDDDWDEANRGEYSVAFGSSNVASGDYSTALGESNDALGRDAMVWGRGNDATAYLSTAWGFVTEASGSFATVWGRSNYATGTLSTAWGNNVESPSYLETALGAYSTTYTPNSSFSWDNDDRLFSIGNGTGSAALSNALTIYKDGTMNINDAYDMPTADGTSGQVLSTDGSGVTSWVDATIDTDDQTLSLTGTDLTITDGNTVDLSSIAGSDDLGNHTATTNIQTSGNYISNDGDNEGIYIQPDGDVGIGTNSPNSLLTLSSTLTNLNSGIQLNNTGTDDWYIYQDANLGLTFRDDGIERLYIDSDGDVGIGTITPNYPLEVDGNARTNNNHYFGTDGAYLSGGNQGGSIELGPSNSAGGEIPFVDFHYGVGASQDYNVRIINDNDNRLTIATNSGGDVLHVDGSSVGIGTIPSYELHVSSNSAAKPTSSAWTVTSDQRLKTNIKSFEDGLNIIEKINPVWFSYNGKAGLPTDERGVGTIAQELQKIAPYMVTNWTYKNEDGVEEDYLGVDYGAMDFVLINAIKEQQQTIEQQERQIKQLEIKAAKTDELERQLKVTNQRLEMIEEFLKQD